MARNPQRWMRLLGGLCMAIVVVMAGMTDALGAGTIRQRGPRPAGTVVPNLQGGDADSAADDDRPKRLPAGRPRPRSRSSPSPAGCSARVDSARRSAIWAPSSTRSEDLFFQPDKGSPVCPSLRAEAQRLIGQMPREGRELYELQYGARARQMLDEALDTGDVARIAEVSRRFFHTRSGYQATFLLGLHHFEHGRPLAGALTLQRLREAGPAAEEFEPDLSLTLRRAGSRRACPRRPARRLAGLAASVIRRSAWRLAAGRCPSSPTTRRRSTGWWA